MGGDSAVLTSVESSFLHCGARTEWSRGQDEYPWGRLSDGTAKSPEAEGHNCWVGLGGRKEQFPSLSYRSAPELSWALGGALKSTQRCQASINACLHLSLRLGEWQEKLGAISIKVVGEAMWVYDSTNLFHVTW